MAERGCWRGGISVPTEGTGMLEQFRRKKEKLFNHRRKRKLIMNLAFNTGHACVSFSINSIKI